MHTYIKRHDCIIAVRQATAKQLRALGYHVIPSTPKLRELRRLRIGVYTMRLVDGHLYGL